MKKYKLKKWVKVVLLIVEAILFTLLLMVIEKDTLSLIIYKLVNLFVFIMIGRLLVKYGDLNE